MTGFALKMLEDNFPSQAKGLNKLKGFYGWAQDGHSEHDLLKSIMGTLHSRP
jgi:hypothetical protein